MKITIETPQFFQGQGRREYQEDSYKISESDRYFIVCDGLGGHANGDLASKTVCSALAVYFDNQPPENYIITKEYFDKAVMFAYSELDRKDPNPTSLRNMGTTMTCVYFGDNGALVAHTGDSRVYQIRPKYYMPDYCKTATILETKDHSLVQQLVDKGEITKEQAKKHPQRNIITKCMTANSDPDMPDYDSCSVIEGDYFFLCSDGVLENITVEVLCSVLAMKISDEEKKQKLFSHCDKKTSDNFTAVLVHVKNGYLPPIDFNAVPTEKSHPPKPSYDPQKTKNLLEKISSYFDEKLKK